MYVPPTMCRVPLLPLLDSLFELSCSHVYYDMSPILCFEELPPYSFAFLSRRFLMSLSSSYHYYSSCFLVLFLSYGLQPPFLLFLCHYFEILLLPVPPFNIPTQSYVRDFTCLYFLYVSNILGYKIKIGASLFYILLFSFL